MAATHQSRSRIPSTHRGEVLVPCVPAHPRMPHPMHSNLPCIARASDNSDHNPDRRRWLTRACTMLLALSFLSGCRDKDAVVEDEAKLAGKTTADFPQITADVFKPMDGGIELSPEEI